MITVVVSIYNVEKYLDRCIQSLMQQTYKDFELLLVDDGSPDQCPQMCDEWEKKDTRITVYHKTNGGLSSARNYGIEHAKGEYIIFPDPDDWVESDYLERLVTLKNEYQADLSICGYYLGNSMLESCTSIAVLNTRDALEQLMMPRSFCGFAWNKLYNMDIIIKNDLRFDLELGMVQDLHFNVRYFQLCDSIAYDPHPLYHYSIDTGGVTSRYTPLTPRKISGLVTYQKIAQLVHGKYPSVEEYAYSSLCKMCLDDIYVYYKSGMKSKETLEKLTNTFLEYRNIFRRSKLYSDREKRCSNLVMLHPLVYYYARRIYWRVIVPFSLKLRSQ